MDQRVIFLLSSISMHPSFPISSISFSLSLCRTRTETESLVFFPIQQHFFGNSPFPTMTISLFLLWLVSIPLLHAAPEPRDYLLNCGSREELDQDGLKFVSDEGFISGGNITTLDRTDILPLLTTLRFFPDIAARKFCYEFQVNKGQNFLIRTTYFYGSYDGGKDPPVFDQIVDGTKWSIVNTTEDYVKGLSAYYEIIVAAQFTTLSVCLARNEHTGPNSHPFISALEVQKLDKSLYNTSKLGEHALVTVARSHFGAGGDIISFPDDPYDRYWQPFVDRNPSVQSHWNITPSAFWNMPPAKVFMTGFTTSRGKTLTVQWPPFPLPSSHYYIALYFQDNRTPSPYSWRIFNVSVNHELFYSDVNVTTDGVTVFGTEWPLNGQTEIELTPRSDMPVGPVINGAELLQILPLGGNTFPRDVHVMEALRKDFDIPPDDWRGDPCLPKENSWSGVKCKKGKHVRIVSLNLTNLALSGNLPDHLGTLTALKDIWLGDNKLTGAIPDLSKLKSLQTLHLENNKFEGPIPEYLGKLTNLREVFLQNNNLDKNIPQALKDRKDINLKY